MKSLKFAAAFALLFSSFLSLAQQNPGKPKVKVTGIVVEKVSKQPLEYATVTFFLPDNPKPIAGGITDNKGAFDIDVTAGTYNINVEFISFQLNEIKAKAITENTNLGTIELAEDATQLKEVVVRAENTTVEIKLDKKVYNVGNDLLVKGGTVSDVLDNIPSVTVDSDGTIALRGNENVRVLIDGRPSNAINVAEALRLIPADAIDKVEVITNPSARYDAEGGGGLLNIILKKGKNQGTNGTIIATVGDPATYGLSGNINYKTPEFNLFTTTGYNYRTNPGNTITNSENFDSSGNTTGFTNERRTNDRLSKGYNSNIGVDWYLDKSTTWSNSVNIRKNDGSNPETAYYDNFDANHDFLSSSKRFNDQISNSTDVEYSTNFVKNFKKEGHKLTIDGAFSQDIDNDSSEINGGSETTANHQTQGRNTVQVNYVLPFGKDSKSQFEAGYKGDFNNLVTDYEVDTFNPETNQYDVNTFYTNILQYKEKINALYTQYGTKINKFSFLLGMRYENTNIDINQFTTAIYNNKKYDFFSPSAFLTYEINDKSSLSLSYSRRISRPRGRQINPFSSYSSNINIFQGNPDLNPAFTDAFDLGFLKKWQKLTLSTSAYVNKTTDSFEFVRKESGDYVVTPVGGADVVDENGNIITVVDGQDIVNPVILTTPINLATEFRYGFEFTLNYTPYKWWKLNSNFNFFQVDKTGDYTYTDFNDQIVTQNFDNTSYSWFTRLTSKVTLPYKVDWQTNLQYSGPQNNAQSHTRGQFGANLGFSKDIMKDKGTLTLNIQDVFNSRKRITETELERQNSYSEMQWRVRSVNLSFTYRFNKKKSDREKQPQKNGDDNGGDDPYQG
ncbi:MAG TPA: outer membrane beta-barrel family protein [Flavobacterium sp.]|nr:outer membrane beta-barrel family protein [Flavobacterium sp.]